MTYNIISNNKIADDWPPATDISSFDRTPESLGYNFLGEKSIELFSPVNATDIFSDEIQLAPLADNGGTTLTHMPLEGSKLIDVGGNPENKEQYDQRGAPFSRISSSGRIDIGAVEASDVSCPKTIAFDAGPNLRVCADSVIFKPSQLPLPVGQARGQSGHQHTP